MSVAFVRRRCNGSLAMCGWGVHVWEVVFAHGQPFHRGRVVFRCPGRGSHG